MADVLDKQLEEQAKEFLNDPTKNRVSVDTVELSKIFSWFGGDFKKKTTLKEYVNAYLKTPIGDDQKIGFMDYDWNLNEADE